MRLRLTGTNARAVFVASALALCPAVAVAQNSPGATGVERPSSDIALARQQEAPPAAGLQNAVTDAVRRFQIGAYGGITLDPEMITFGAYGSFGTIFSRAVAFRPGLYLSFGEVTTEFAVDLDVVYTLPDTGGAAWQPYIGAGPNLSLSHKGFEEPAGSGDNSTTTTTTTGGTTITTETPSRFDFGDTSFDTGFNFIVGARRSNGVFFEMKATAYGVAGVKLLAGFRF